MDVEKDTDQDKSLIDDEGKGTEKKKHSDGGNENSEGNGEGSSVSIDDDDIELQNREDIVAEYSGIALPYFFKPWVVTAVFIGAVLVQAVLGGVFFVFGYTQVNTLNCTQICGEIVEVFVDFGNAFLAMIAVAFTIYHILRTQKFGKGRCCCFCTPLAISSAMVLFGIVQIFYDIFSKDNLLQVVPVDALIIVLSIANCVLTSFVVGVHKNSLAPRRTKRKSRPTESSPLTKAVQKIESERKIKNV